MVNNMVRRNKIVGILLALCWVTAGYGQAVKGLTPVTFEKVRMEDSFWLPRLKRQKSTLVPFALKNTEPAVENLRRVGDYLRTGS